MVDEILSITTVYSVTTRVGGPPMVLRMDVDLSGMDTVAVRVSWPRKHRPCCDDVGRRGVVLGRTHCSSSVIQSARSGPGPPPQTASDTSKSRNSGHAFCNRPLAPA